MRQLILVRHAKSDRDEPGYTDLERPLSARGARDAPRMARRLRDRVPGLDLLVTSPAARARQTARCFADEYGIDADAVQEVAALYTFAQDAQLQALRSSLPDAVETAAMFAHNPATSRVVRFLSGQDMADLPTCAVVRFEVQADSWRALEPEVCVLCEVDTPKGGAAE